jgi:hypothetical protein
MVRETKQVCLDDRRFVDTIIDVGSVVSMSAGVWRNFQKTRSRKRNWGFSRVTRASFDWFGD